VMYIKFYDMRDQQQIVSRSELTLME